MDWHTENSKEKEGKLLEKKDIPEEVEEKDSKPEYKDYKTWKEIPEKERKHYGI